jgi:hypothetical protein
MFFRFLSSYAFGLHFITVGTEKGNSFKTSHQHE